MSDRLLVLVRHGQSEWNLKNLFTGWKDPDLTEQGVAEAVEAGRKLKGQGLVFDVAFTSVLTRAQHTLDLMLGEAAAAGRQIALSDHSARGRDGETGARRAGDIGFASLRGGSVTGDHSVIFAGAMERIELTHRAEDRTMFAQGAVKAALWARNKKPGLYSMADVLGLGNF